MHQNTLTITDQQKMAICLMTRNTLLALDYQERDVPLDTPRRASLGNLIDQLEGAVALASWAHGAPLKPLPEDCCTLVFFSVLTDVLQPSPEDAGLFADQVNELREIAETVRDGQPAESMAKTALCSILSRMNALTESSLRATYR